MGAQFDNFILDLDVVPHPYLIVKSAAPCDDPVEFGQKSHPLATEWRTVSNGNPFYVRGRGVCLLHERCGENAFFI